ncbi:MAG TPA: choline/carnitine O-acyltransferase [Pseudonocardia sp.]|jgi:carnitine O-acetyltransferase
MTSGRDYPTRTFAHEDELPRVPLPTLEDSGARFLEWCAPLLTPAQLAETREAVDELLAPDSPARTLHAELARFDAEPDTRSWLDRFWPSRYLGRRDRIALNANFAFLFRDEPRDPLPDVDRQLSRAARLISAAVDYKLLLDEERIRPVILRGQPQSMDQQRYLFSTTRIPGAEQDSVRAPYSAERPGPSPARHILVLSGGRLTALDVLDEDRRPYPESVLVAALDGVRAAGPARDVPVGHLTTMARAEWAAHRARLGELDPANAAALDTVESALFCLCLDDPPADGAPTDRHAASDQILHGGHGNRWFDKSVSLVVLADGRAGINIEHCGLDGTTVLAFVDGILVPDPAGPDGGPSVELSRGEPVSAPVEFVLDDELRGVASAAAEEFAEFAGATASELVTFDDFGADRAKKLGVSPDAFAQLAYQLAHRRAKGITGATYESIATRQFRLGRTEAMRVVTPEVLRFVAAMDDPDAGPDTRREAFGAAAEAHVTRAKDCQRGRAPEQHLWELQWIAQRAGAELGVTGPLALYDSPGWRIMRDDYLSTSSAPSVNIECFGFGSTSSHCIGVAYVLLPDRFNLYLSTPARVADQMTAFAEELRLAVGELAELLT